MAILPSTVVSKARQILQDTVADYRFTDSDLVGYINTAILEAYRIRPDLFIGLDMVVPTVTTGSVGTPLALEASYETAFVLMVVGLAELREDQFTQDGRAAMALSRFSQMLTQAA